MSDKKQPTRSELEIKIKGYAAILISFLAACLAINTMIGGSNSSKIMNNTIAANNLWAWYQAKNMRQVIYEIAAVEAQDRGNVTKAEELRKEVARLESEPEKQEGKKELAARAKALEAERDQARKKSPWFSYAGSTMQIGIVLCTASILAVSLSLFFASAIVGFIGALLMANGHFLLFVL